MRRLLAGAAAAVLVIALVGGAGGCGGSGATQFPATERFRAGGGGTLAYALAGEAGSLDPLTAGAPAQRMVSRQIFEPLVARLQGPYERVGDSRGLALEWQASPDRRVWSFSLRPNVRFQDGTPFNSSAVVANVTRWRNDPSGQLILPELAAVDAPRPDQARIILSIPLANLPRRLADPRLGLVSPRALPGLGSNPTEEDVADSGSGPFEPSAQQPEGAVLLRRNRRWWGSRLGLGPALDRIEFREVPDAGERIALLRRGLVRVAEGVGRREAERLSLDPLLSVVGEGSDFIAMERSVRGITESGPQPLSGVWLTLVGQGG
jgi:peptide/nickel transport system substrate-binding protein